MRIVSKLYDSNEFILENNNKVLIVDCGVPAKEIENYVQGKEVVGILLTHGHFDHAFYVEDYIKTFKTKVYASEFIKEYLEDSKKNYSTDEGLFLEVKDFNNFIFLSNCGKFKLADFEFEYTSLGGHSKSDMCYLIDNELYVGDVIIGRGIGRMDLYGGNREEMIESLGKISKINYQKMHCGHGEDMPKQAQDKVITTYLRFLKR